MPPAADLEGARGLAHLVGELARFRSNPSIEPENTCDEAS
jgi:hypothetical protein